MAEIIHEIPVMAEFICELRIHNRVSFIATGRMIFQLYRKNPDPTQPDIRRPWEGDSVFDLRLMHKGVQVHRVLSDSREDAERMMREAIPLQFAAWATREQIAAYGQSEYDLINSERKELAVFIEANYQAEIAAGKHAGRSLVDVLTHYLSIERNRWRVKLGKWIRKPKRADIAPEWKG